MLVTPEQSPRELKSRDWVEIVELLEQVYSCYAFMYFPSSKKEAENARQRDGRLAMPAFIDYFFTANLSYTDQVSERIERWFKPFDSEVRREFGLGALQLLEITKLAQIQIQATLDVVADAAENEQVQRHAFLDLAKSRRWDLKQMREQARDHPCRGASRDLFQAMNDLWVLDPKALCGKFSEQEVEAFVGFFEGRRGRVGDYFYPTDRNPAANYPFLVAEDERIYVPAAGQLLDSLLNRLLAWAESEEGLRTRFHVHRDMEVERSVVRAFEGFVPADAEMWPGACEEASGQLEHDLVVLVDETVLIVEVKASPPKEPFRDAEKAYRRLKRAFRSDKGIQGAFQQANRLRRRLVAGERVELFDGRGEKLCEIHQPREVFNICVTADRHGIVATDLSQLLSKDRDDPFPWAVGLSDLQVILQILQYRQLGWAGLADYLRQRAPLHGLVVGTDEMEFFGWFLKNGGFRGLPENVDLVQLTFDMSDVVDNLYFEMNGMEPPHDASLDEPVEFLNTREELGKALQKDEDLVRKHRGKVGRNDPCPCKSGKKFKKCHGRPRRTG